MNHIPNYKNSFRILKGGKISLVVSAFLASTTLTFAAPSGGVVTSGSANISQTGKVTDITQSTQKASINWNKFNVANDETVNFKQPNVNSITLNRVVGNEKSIINGALNANGQVWILNSNGVLFSKDAKVNTAGLLATTKELSDTDFQAGNYNFKGNSKESVINLGTIDVVNGGSVILAANEVRNEGTIKAVKGKVHLVGANEYTVNLNGNSLVNLTVNKGVLDALVKNSGTIIADGGEVYLTTNAVNELLKGVVNNTGVIEANSMDELFGKVELFAHGGTAQIDGTIKAKGGFVETSGKNLNVESSAKIETSKWLLDPDNMIIESTGGATLTGESVSATAIQNALISADIELQATTNIAVNENITWSTNKQLKLSADSINVNATIENKNTANGGVFFNAANTNNKVRFDATTGKVIIHNIYQLQWMNTAVEGNYELGSNIDAAVTSGWNSNKGWLPIGASAVYGMDYTPANPFKGNFDGLGHIISNLYINDDSKSGAGLFGATSGATIKNINLFSVDITANGDVGGLVGSSSDSTIQNTSVSGTIKGSSNNTGGLVGSASSSTISNSYSTATIEASQYSGGLVGNNSGGSIIENSYAAGSVSGENNVGGLVGGNNSSTIKNSYATGGATGSTSVVGGLVGVTMGASVIENSYASSAGAIIGTANLGGLVGFSYGVDGTIINSYYDNQANTTMSNTILGRTKAEIVGLIGGDGTGAIWGINGSTAEGYVDNKSLPFLKGVTATLFDSGTGIAGNTYKITNWTQLQNINNSNILTQNKHFSLSNNLSNATSDYNTKNSGTGWNPLGNDSTLFQGTFDGNGKTISNLYINNSTKNYVGLFGVTSDAIIKNLGLVDVSILGQDMAGGLVGWNWSSTAIENSYASGTVSGKARVGGLVGWNGNSSITNSYASGAVSGTNFVGGLVGYNLNNSSIENSYASGTVIGTGGNVGGLAGDNAGTSSITDSSYDKEANTRAMSDAASGKTKAEIITAFSGKTGWTTVGGGGAAVAGYELLLLPYLTDVTRDADKSFGTLFEGGMGVDGDAYTITNWTQLQNINNSNILTQAYYFSLLNNLSNATSDYSNLASNTANTDTGWNPIGNITNKFSGTFNGAGNTISNLFINRTNQDNIGLFGYTNGATIKNLGLVNVNITGKDQVGALVGYNNNSIINNSFSTGTVTSSGENSGGLVGWNKGNTAQINHSYSTVNVTANGVSSNRSGGLVGWNKDGAKVTNSYATGSVVGKDGVGGLVGSNESNSIIENSYSKGTISGTGGSVGGLVGYTAFSTITSSFYDKTINLGMNNEVHYGKTTADMKKSSTFTGWDMLEDSNATPDYPTLRMASSGKIWVIGTKAATPPSPDPIVPTPPAPTPTPDPIVPTPDPVVPTPDPVVPTPDPVVPTPDPVVPEPEAAPKVPEKIIRAAENSVTPPIVRLPNTSISSTSNIGTGSSSSTSNVNVVSQPTSSQSSQSVSLGQLQQSQTEEPGSQGFVSDIRVPASANSQIILVNGGVRLPDGVEQEFYVSANQNNTSNESKEK